MAQHTTCDKCGERVGEHSWRLDLHKRGDFLKMFEGQDLCPKCGALMIRVLTEAGFGFTEVALSGVTLATSGG